MFTTNPSQNRINATPLVEKLEFISGVSPKTGKINIWLVLCILSLQFQTLH